MEQALIGIGGNIGNVLDTFAKAFISITNLPDVYNISISRIFETTPVSHIPQPNYLNAVIRIETTKSCQQLLMDLQHIEHDLGKIQKEKEAPRPIDLDIIFFGKQRIDQPHLKVPHPFWKQRLFVLIPLLDLLSTIEVEGDNPQEIERFDLEKIAALASRQSKELVTPISVGMDHLTNCAGDI